MKVAIHSSKWGFSKDWANYCDKMGIDYILVNCYDNDIINQISDCDALLWHHHHSIPQDALFARELLFALQQAGKKVFPDFNTGWHFDDKLGQKYLLEAIGAPMALTWVFYERNKALTWTRTAKFPIVFKLRGGAGSSNVKLILNVSQAAKYIRKAFGTGFPTYDKFGDLKEQFRIFNGSRRSFVSIAKSIRRLFVSTPFARTLGPQKGYVLFQEFLPNNTYDTRVITIGQRAFAIKRLVRHNDFRASGSGKILFDKGEIDLRCVSIAFNITKKLNSKCVAYDFVFDQSNQPKIVEINYGFAHEAYFQCPGYWDDKMIWHEGKFNAAEWLVEELVKE